MTRAAPFVVSGVVAVYFAAFWWYGILLEDEGLILLQAARALRGELPYVDFHTGYPPGGFYLNALLFRVFGESVVPVRVVLAAVNAASAGLLFALARRVADPRLAAVVALGWATHLPVFVGLFASFNVPYPSWYGTCAFLATQWACDRHVATGRRLPLFAAGLAAGVAFSIKQNTGALAVLACGLVGAVLHAGVGDRDRRLARLLLVLAAAFLLAGFTVAVTSVESAFIIGPTLVLIAGRLGWAVRQMTAPIRLTPGTALVAAGALLVAGIWLVPFLAVLGVRGLMREIFLVGTNFDLVYATPYPIGFGFPDGWPIVGALGLGVLAGAGLAAENGRVAARTARLVALAGVLGGVLIVWRWARMPEGLARSVTLQAQHLGFFAAPALHLAVVIGWLRRVRSARPAPDARFLTMLVFALCGFAGLYPRIDETHLVMVLPSSLVLAAWAATRLAHAWAPAFGVPARRVVQGLTAAGCALLLLAALPNFRAHLVVRDGSVHRRSVVPVASPAAPVHLDDAHTADTQALNALLAWLRARLRPGEGLFGFPSMGLVPYLLGHPSVTRHDYWYAGRPDHLEEAEVVRALAAEPPRFVVTINRNVGFFSNSARYYFILRALLQDRYALAARFGRYDVLARRELVTAPPPVEDFVESIDDDLRARLVEPLSEARRAAIRAFLARARSREEVDTLATVVAPDEPSLLVLLRGMTEAPDLRTLPFVAARFDAGTWRVRAQAAATLNYAALHAAEHRYLPGSPAAAPGPTPRDLASAVDPAMALRWLADPRRRFQAGAFAVWLLAGVNDAEATPYFLDIVHGDTKDPYLRLLGAYGLVRAGLLEYLWTLIGYLGDARHEYQDAVPSLLLEAAASHRAEVADGLSDGLTDRRALGREMSAWTVGAAGLTEVAPSLRRALGDPERRVRCAAAWALGRLGDQTARDPLEALANDPDAQIRAFASEALARLGGGPS